MASRVANPYGAATPLGEGLANTFNAFLSAPTPEQRAAEALKLHGMQAQAKSDLANAGKAEAETRGIDQFNTGITGLQRDVGGWNADTPITQIFQSALPLLQKQNGQGFGDTVRALAYGVNSPAAERTFMGAGGNFANTESGFNATDATNRRGQDVTAQTQRYGYDTQAATSRANNAADNSRAILTNYADNARAVIQTKLQEAGLDSRKAAELANNIVIQQMSDTAAGSRNAADNARAIQTNAADNARALQTNVNDNQFKRDTFSVNTPAGTITTLAPGNPLGKTEITGLPTDATQKGGLIQTMRSEPGFDPNAPLDAQSSYGAALGVPNEPKEGGGLALTVGPDGTVQMTQGGNGVQLPTSTISNNLEAQDSIGSFLRVAKDLRDVAMTDPTLFGTAGNVRRFLQSAATQADTLLQMAGKSDPNAVKDVNTVFDTVVGDLAAAGVQDPSVYDPNLTDIDKLAILAAYQAAAAIAGQEGRGLSNEDFLKFRTIVGDPTAWGSTQQSFVAGLNRLERLAIAELNARRARLGQTPVDPATFGQQPQGGIQTVNTPEEAARLPKGTKFRTPDGRVKVVP